MKTKHLTYEFQGREFGSEVCTHSVVVWYYVMNITLLCIVVILTWVFVYTSVCIQNLTRNQTEWHVNKTAFLNYAYFPKLDYQHIHRLPGFKYLTSTFPNTSKDLMLLS